MSVSQQENLKPIHSHYQLQLPTLKSSAPKSSTPRLSVTPVSFYLGYSKLSIGSCDSLSSSIDDNESCSDYYTAVDPDYHFGDCFDSPSILRPCLSQLLSSTCSSSSINPGSNTTTQIPSLQESFTSTLVDYMCDSKSIVAASSAVNSGVPARIGKSIPPSPPMSPLLFAHPTSRFIENIDSDNSYTTLHDNTNFWSPKPLYRLTAKDPTENKTIPINLDPVSPLLLAAAVTDSSESLVGLERKAVEELNLELHPYISDKFHQRPLLADPELPFIPSEPVFPHVEELFEEYYSELIPGSVEFIYHKERLLRNRIKLKKLSQTMNQHEDERRRLISLARLNGLESQPRSRVKLY